MTGKGGEKCVGGSQASIFLQVDNHQASGLLSPANTARKQTPHGESLTKEPTGKLGGMNFPRIVGV